MINPECQHGPRMFYPARESHGRWLKDAWLCRASGASKCPTLLDEDWKTSASARGVENIEDIPPWERIDPDELTDLINIAETVEDLNQLWNDYRESWIQEVHSPVACRRKTQIKAARP